MSLWDYDGKLYTDANGNTYHIIGERILTNESTVLKSWFGCTTVKDIFHMGTTLHVKFETGELDIQGVTEVRTTKPKPKEESKLGVCMLFTPGRPEENLKALRKKEE